LACRESDTELESKVDTAIQSNERMTQPEQADDQIGSRRGAKHSDLDRGGGICRPLSLTSPI